MINYYQPWTLPFLGRTKNKLPKNIKRHYYYSFEDALWNLLIAKKVPKGSVFLVPSFYCQDVLDNIKNHGFEYVFYTLDENFQISTGKFQKFLKKYKPKVIIIFHACGITSNLIRDLTWQKYLSSETLIIEDGVHRLVNPEKVKLINNNHFLIDSLRKVSPFPGSFIYGTERGLNFAQPKSLYFSAYFLSSIFYYLTFRFVFKLSMLLKLSSLISWSHRFLLKKHDDIIGDSLIPYAGLPIYLYFLNRIDFKKIENLKSEQVKKYERSLAKIFKKTNYYRVKIPSSDFSRLHVYPLGYKIKPDTKLEEYLEKRGAIIWFKFPDSPWSANKGILFLPLGFHITNKNIEFISDSLSEVSAKMG